RQLAACAVEDVRERRPRAEDLDLSLKARPRVEPLEHTHVRIGPELIRIDARIEDARRHLVVAGIREPERVRDARDTAARAVAVGLALRRHRLPEERKK